MPRPALDYVVLDAVADDVESFPHIRDQIVPSGPSQASALVASLRGLVQERLVEACTVPTDETELVSAGEGSWPPSNVDDMWFRITGRGKMVHEAWASGAEGAA